MNWKQKFPKFYRLLAKIRFAIANEKVIDLPFGAKMRINPFSFSERLINEGSFEIHRVAFFQGILNDKVVFFDIGANVGYYTLLASTLGARVHAFEPEPFNLSRLRYNLTLNPAISGLTTIWPIALGNHSGSTEFGRPLSDNYGHASLLIDNSFERISVPMERFEDIPCDGELRRVFKIDVEGAEEQVLDGMGRSWEDTNQVIFLVEVHRQFGANLSRIIEIFRSKKFALSFLDDVTGDESPYPFDGGDVVLIARRE